MICKICLSKSKNNIKLKNIDEIYTYSTCDECKGGIINPYPIRATDLNKYQTEKYFENLSKPVKNSLINKFLNLKTYTLPQEFVNNKYIKGDALDVGCGNGEYLEYLYKKGWKVWGSDISKIAINKTSKKINNTNNLFHGEFTKIKSNHFFDVISFWHVLEHTDNPKEYLIKAYSLLKQDGVVIGEVPNYESILLRIFKKNYNWLMLPEHNLYFSPKSLAILAEEIGYTKFNIIYTPRAVLNLSLSIKKAFKNSMLGIILGIVSIPISIIVGFTLAHFNKGEVIRFEMYK